MPSVLIHINIVKIKKTSPHPTSSSQLWRSLSTMLGRDRDTFGATGHTADGFAEFFSRKVDDVMSSTAGQPAPTIIDSAPSSLPSFRRCSETEVRRIVMSSAVKSCSLDPVPTFLLREFVDLLLP